MEQYLYHGFATHTWQFDGLGRSTHERVVHVCNILRNHHNVHLWIDEERMQGHIQKAMCSGIDNSATFVIFATNVYVSKVIGDNVNDNCKLEFEYGMHNRKRTSLLVMMEEGVKLLGVMQMHLGNELYIDMSQGDVPSDVKIADLASRITAVIREYGLVVSHDVASQRSPDRGALSPAASSADASPPSAQSLVNVLIGLRPGDVAGIKKQLRKIKLFAKPGSGNVTMLCEAGVTEAIYNKAYSASFLDDDGVSEKVLISLADCFIKLRSCGEDSSGMFGDSFGGSLVDLFQDLSMDDDGSEELKLKAAEVCSVLNHASKKTQEVASDNTDKKSEQPASDDTNKKSEQPASDGTNKKIGQSGSDNGNMRTQVFASDVEAMSEDELVSTLSTSDLPTKLLCLQRLAKLSLDGDNRVPIANAGAIPPLVKLLQDSKDT
eukprot:Rmarinus@m.25206